MTKLKSLLSLCLALLLFLTGPTGVLAAEPPPSAQAQAVIELIDAGLQDHQQEIAVLSQGLTITERERIFFERQKQPAPGILVNGLLAFGIGSFMMGDKAGGFIEFIGELATAGLFCSILFLDKVISGSEKQELILFQDSPLIWIGLAWIIGFRIFGLIRPIFFVHGYNQDLQTALGYSPTREEAKPQESPPQAPQPELAPYLDSQGGGGLKFGWAF